MEITLDQFINNDVLIQNNFKNILSNLNIVLVTKSHGKISGNLSYSPLISRANIKCDSIGIYVIRQKTTGVFYIGSTSCLCKRKSLHIRRAIKNIHFNKNFQNIFNKTPVCDFEFRSFELIDKNDLIRNREIMFDLEQEVLQNYYGLDKCLNNSNNSKIVGSGWIRDEKYRTNVSLSLKGIKRSDETKTKMSIAQKGHIVLPHVINKIQEVNRREVYINGKAYMSTIDAARHLGISNITVYRKLNSEKYRDLNWNYVDQLWDIH